MPIVIMILSAGAIIAIVRFGLIAGLDHVSGALGWSPKARGQAMGYATSAPELVTLVAAGLSGVWEAGLWNIASSNLINVALMLAAVLRYGHMRKLFNRRFMDEIGFSLLGILAPLLLMKAGMDTEWPVIPILLGVFVTYQVVDRKLNPKEELSAQEAVGSLPIGVILLTTALVLLAVVGTFLGDATRGVIEQMGLHPAVAGWILGLMTSLPEAVTFFSVYAASKKAGTDHLLDDTQEALDNLAASNMSNTGLIYPIGLAVYLLAAQF